MGAAQIIKDNYRHLTLPERKLIVQQLIEDMDKELPTEQLPNVHITEEMKAKKPWLGLVGRWSKEQGDAVMKAIKEADWIDE